MDIGKLVSFELAKMLFDIPINICANKSYVKGKLKHQHYNGCIQDGKCINAYAALKSRTYSRTHS